MFSQIPYSFSLADIQTIRSRQKTSSSVAYLTPKPTSVAFSPLLCIEALRSVDLRSRLLRRGNIDRRLPLYSPHERDRQFCSFPTLVFSNSTPPLFLLCFSSSFLPGWVLMADELSSSVNSSPLASFMPTISPSAPCLRELKSDERGLFLIHLLLNCAAHVAAGDLEQANAFLEHISLLASPDGDTMQRIASYFTEALARRLLRSWPGLYHAVIPHCSVSSAAGVSAARRDFLDICPFLRLSSAVSNQAILEAMEAERVVHIVDLGGSDPSLWLNLLREFAGRPDGPPHLRFTAVGEERELLARAGCILSEEAEKLDIPFQFNAVISRLDTVGVETLRVKTGEAVAVSSVLQLHSVIDDDKIFPSKIETFLSSLWGLSPKIMVITEQESHHNGATLNERFMEALYFYAALFDCLESTVPRRSQERSGVEKLIFGEEIKNIIACEGPERRERHEKLERWVRRLEVCGFGRLALSYYGLLQARRLLQGFAGGEGYQVREEKGCFLLCWQERALFSVSAWRFNRFD